MDESALTLGTIDVSYLPNSSEYSVGRCKHVNEEWVSFIHFRSIQPKDVCFSVVYEGSWKRYNIK